LNKEVDKRCFLPNYRLARVSVGGCAAGVSWVARSPSRYKDTRQLP